MKSIHLYKHSSAWWTVCVSNTVVYLDLKGNMRGCLEAQLIGNLMENTSTYLC